MPQTSLPVMNFLCFGVGAIGTYIGGSLMLAGHKVVFLERPEVAAQIRERGLHLALKGREYALPAPDVVSTLDEALTHGPFDVALLAVKSFDTPGVLEMITPYSVALPPVLCLQNGVENETLLAGVLGAEKVIAGTITSAVGRRGAGDIVLERLRGMGIAAQHVLTPTLAAVMSAAGLKAQVYENGESMKWSKMLTNLLANASSAILDMPPAEIFLHPGLYRMEVRMLREALMVMSAGHIPVTSLPGTPVRALVDLAWWLPPAVSQPLLNQALGRGRGGKMPSFHIDLYGGRGKSEVDYLNGAVVRFGERWGVATPVNDLLNRTLLALTRGEIPTAVYAHQPERLLALLAQ